MQNVILVIHILAVLVMTGLVLIQKSEGGALGIGGGGGGLMGGRGAANAIVRTTILFGAAFFVTSLALTTIASRSDEGLSAIEKAKQEKIDAQNKGNDESGPVDFLDPTAPLLGTPDPAPESTPETPAETTPPAPADTPVDGAASEASDTGTPTEDDTPQ